MNRYLPRSHTPKEGVIPIGGNPQVAISYSWECSNLSNEVIEVAPGWVFRIPSGTLLNISPFAIEGTLTFVIDNSNPFRLLDYNARPQTINPGTSGGFGGVVSIGKELFFNLGDINVLHLAWGRVIGETRWFTFGGHGDSDLFSVA